MKAQVDLLEQGFAVLLPLTEHCPFDLVAYKDGEFRRVQVKYRRPDSFGSTASLRVRTPKNRQQERVHFADDFRRDP